ncbi:MAG: hypothetical protein B1H13_09225 [Desulfobacteraceae bacterium 4484_190.3]|nr:MAG: hypothetical protein B1H13_09225 [Desulfobacteraceae bacterium 4484_190.3]
MLNEDYVIKFPVDEHGLDQDEEFIIMDTGKQSEKIRLHDYKRIYNVPGLYEEALYKRLKCESPQVLCSLLQCETLVGVDIIPEARKAALRDRPDLYDDYFVVDFNELEEADERQLQKYDFNMLVTIAALGYNHIGAEAFLKAFDFVDDNAWIVFNIKDSFLSEGDDSGFEKTLSTLMDSRLSVLKKNHYCHRLSIANEPLYYYGIVSKKNE